MSEGTHTKDTTSVDNSTKSGTVTSQSQGSKRTNQSSAYRSASHQDTSAPISDAEYAEQLRREGRDFSFFKDMEEIRRTHGPMPPMTTDIMMRAYTEIYGSDGKS
ncbi:hypothetical protein L486_04801 [Kwoniella mangroviensis CBS 10435]|uniref:Uncharacterized protein n=1 Tax=Kwoniella mangroviensis CBS 10435 TaxID=1331196 RepID=A0A1B9IP37_9TREE|nr:uncharacterized protein I203_00459 [Kwoniella mangroviensis CBS 8507]OCF57345.1 hypothetical protein L486_04801 [Kwoniella mangroviensis CBS 10435]OCF70325.1 hypothetical protein I203_00459 [Kwoniella mangroviensis CBS 8507]